jgi:hypothetical protein
MFDKKNVFTFIVCLIILSTISAAITYRIVIRKSNDKVIIKENLEKKDIELVPKKIGNYGQTEFGANDVFNDVKKMSIVNDAQSTTGIDLEEGKNRKVVIASTKSLYKKKVEDEEFIREGIGLNENNYEIYINHDIKLKFYSETGYMTIGLIESQENKRYIYKLNKKELVSFIKILEKIYLEEAPKKN